MKFSKGTTFNSHDTTLRATDTGRILAYRGNRGVRSRCELVVAALLRTPTGGTTAELTETLNRRLRANYTESDIRYAAKRLADDRIISNRRGHYRANANTLARWTAAKG